MKIQEIRMNKLYFNKSLIDFNLNCSEKYTQILQKEKKLTFTHETFA